MSGVHQLLVNDHLTWETDDYSFVRGFCAAGCGFVGKSEETGGEEIRRELDDQFREWHGMDLRIVNDYPADDPAPIKLPGLRRRR